MANVKVFMDKQTDRLTDGQTDRPKFICPNLSIWGIKIFKGGLFLCRTISHVFIHQSEVILAMYTLQKCFQDSLP